MTMIDSPPLTARRAATRQKLLDAAFSVFAENGVLASTVEEICEKAGFTRGAFYSNFSSKDDLCIALMERGRQEDIEATSSTLAAVDLSDEHAPIETIIASAIERFLASQPRGRDAILVNAELRLYAARTPDVREAYSAFYDESARMFASLVLPPLHRAGYELRLPAPQAMGLLQAVFQEGQLGFLLERTEEDQARVKENLVAVFFAMLVRPLT